MSGSLKDLLTPTDWRGVGEEMLCKLKAINFPDIFISITTQKCLLVFLTG